MVEAHLPGILQRDRPAKPYAAEQHELFAPFQQQADQLEEILVPANGDAVFRDTPEASHDPLVEVLVKGGDIAHRLERDTGAPSADARNAPI
jgi:hypothetical protein